MLLGRKQRTARGPAAGATVSLYYASDVHGSERCWRKFLGAGRFYGVQALVMGGDLTGKAIVPIETRDDGSFEALFIGETRSGKTAEELEELMDAIRFNGMYPWLASAEIATAALSNRPSRLIKPGRRMIESEQFSKRDIAELAAALATREMQASRRRAKQRANGTCSASTTRRHDTRYTGSRLRWPRARSPVRSTWPLWKTAGTRGLSCGFPRAGRSSEKKAGRRRSTGCGMPRQRRAGRSSRCSAGNRSRRFLKQPCVTSVSSKQMRLPDGRAAPCRARGCQRNLNGSMQRAVWTHSHVVLRTIRSC